MSPLFRRRSVLPAALALGLLLSGCISLFPKTQPAQLYSLNQAPPPPAVAAPAGLTLARGAVAFPSDAGGDQILTVTGQQAAFIAGARWLEPASLMFDEAVMAAFDQPGAPRLAGRGESVAAATTLRLDVRRFEADYDQGPGAAPTVTVSVRAALIRSGDRTVMAEKLFEVRQPAAENRVGAIVAAYNTAVAQTVAAIRDWSAANAAPL